MSQPTLHKTTLVQNGHTQTLEPKNKTDKSAIVAVYDTHAEAETAVRDL